MRLLVFVVTAAMACMGPEDASFEVSTSFDTPDAVSFLDRVAALLDAKNEFRPIIGALPNVPLDAERSWGLQVHFNGRDYPLSIVAYTDDIDVTDLYFFTEPGLGVAIEGELEHFIAELGT